MEKTNWRESPVSASCKLKKLFFLSVTILFFFSCKKKTEILEHEIQFQANLSGSASTYSLLIDGVNQTDLNAVYKLKVDANIQLMMIRDTSITWLSGTIYQDGKAVKYDAGYKDIDLTYSVK